ncbi:MAG TPA: mechanosensitive ion channel family protein [Balneolaceae bacterium]
MENFTDVIYNYWERFLEFAPLLALGLLILIISVFIAAWISASLNKYLGKRMDDPLLVRFISRMAKGILIVIGLFLALEIIGLGGIAAGLLASAGLSAFIIGFAFKDIAENFLAGIILSFDRPFHLNDTVCIVDYVGHVTSLDFRTTKIKTFDGKDVFIPNATILKEPLVNYTRDGLIRIEFITGIDYGDDIQRATDLIVNTLLSFDEVIKDDPPYAIVDELAASTVNLRIFFWTATNDYKKGVNLLRGHIIRTVKEALLDKGFGLPANIQELKIYKAEHPFPVKLYRENGMEQITEKPSQ